jgi:lipocalin
MKKIGIFIIFILGTKLLLNCNQEEMNNIETSTVENFELNRYLGTWYEIARFQNSFEKDLVGVTAKYSLRDDGKIKVVNSGYKDSFSGKYKTITGKAKVPDKSNPAKLKVSFFLFFYGDYYVLELDTVNYGYALVGSSSENYLWILSRTPSLPAEIYDMLVSKARDRGYNVSLLYKVPQKEQI